MLHIFKKFTPKAATVALTFIAFQASAQKVWTLKECVDQALSHNITIQQQTLTTQSTKADFLQSKMALLPTLNGNVNNNWQTGFAINPATNIAKEGVAFRTNSFGLSSSMPLFNGFQTVNNMRLQQSNHKASEFDLEQTKNNITLNICNLYLRVLQNTELANSAGARVEATRAQVEKQRKMFELGSSNKSKYLQLKAQLSSEELALVNANNALSQAYLDLWLAIDIKPDPANTVELPKTEVEIQDEAKPLDEIFNEFCEKSPDVRATGQRARSSEIQHNLALGGRSPRLTLTGSLNSFYSTQSTTGVGDIQYQVVQIGYGNYNSQVIPVYSQTPTGFGSYKTTPFSDQFNKNFGTNIGLSLSVPIFNGWNVNTNIQKARLSQQNARLNDKQTRNNLYKSIAQTYYDFKSSRKKFEANKENLDANKESFDVAEKQFELGAINMADYLNTKNSYIRAEADYTQAKYELAFRRKTLDFYLGKSLY